jgi:hypothetical protein
MFFLNEHYPKTKFITPLKHNKMRVISLLAYTGILLVSCNKDKPGKGQEFADFTVNWTKCWGTDKADDFAGSVIDNSGNLYFVGASEPDGYQGDIFLNKVSLTTPSLSWSKKFDSGNQDYMPSPSQNGHANGGGGSRCIALDAAGNVYITGSTKDGFFEVFVMKINASGDVVWETRWEANTGTLANGEAKAYAIDVAGDKVFVTGSSAAGVSASGSAMTFLLTLDQATGNVHAGTNVGFDASPTYNDIGYTVKSPDGNIVYIAGWEGAQNSAVIYKFSAAGEVFEWQEKIDLGYTHRFTDIDLDASGNIYLAADFRGVSTYIGVVKLNSSGDLQWAKKIQGESNDRNNISVLRVIDGAIYIGGRGSYEHYDVGQFSDGTFMKLDLNGTVLKAYNYYSEDFTTGERIEGIHQYGGNLILIGETWPESIGIEGRWYIPQLNETSISPSVSKITTTTIMTGDGVTNSSAMQVSTLSSSLYDPADGTKGSADIMIHSIKN